MFINTLIQLHRFSKYLTFNDNTFMQLICDLYSDRLPTNSYFLTCTNDNSCISQHFVCQSENTS